MRLFSLLAVVLLAPALAQSGLSPGAPDPNRPVSIPLEPYVGRLLTARVNVHGRELKLLFDTGAGQTLVTPDAAGLIGCTPRGRTTGFRMSGERVDFGQCAISGITIGGRSFGRETIGVWDLMSILPAGLPAVDGVLALDVFRDHLLTIDLAGRTLMVETSPTLRGRGRPPRPVRARIATGSSGADLTVFLRAKTTTAGWFLLDSGNLDAVLVAPHMAPAAGGGFAVDGLGEAGDPTRVRELIYDGVLSEAYLRRFTWTLDLRRGEVWAVSRR